MKRLEELLCFMRNREEDFQYYVKYPFSKISTIHTGGEIPILIYPKNDVAIIDIIKKCIDTSSEYKLIGNASNIIPPDENYNTVIISTRRFKSIYSYGNTVICSSGTQLSSLILYATANGLCGYENLYGIPASVGGAVIMNAGAFGTMISDCLISVTCYDTERDVIISFTADDMNYSYRNSAIKNSQYVVLYAEFCFHSDEREKITERAKKAKEMKILTQPIKMRSAGSIFLRQEPDVIPARLIDRAGLKGMRVGGASVSEKHAGFIVNDANATSGDVIKLIDTIQRIMYEKNGVHLETEVEIMRKEGE